VRPGTGGGWSCLDEELLMKVLCYVNHYCGPGVGFRGKSTEPGNPQRREIVERCVAQLRTLNGADVRVCGIPGCALVPLDLEFPQIRDKPTHLIYESLAHMAGQVEGYDYFINTEDDILVPAQTLENAVEFDRTALLNEVLHPNRLETAANGRQYCTDIEVSLRWTRQHRRWQGHELRVALNPHSGILILSRDKIRYALRNIDISYRGVFMPHAMESAFANFLSPFCLYRSQDDLNFHVVQHLDRWLGADELERLHQLTEPAWRRRLKRVIRDWAPPILLRAVSRHSEND
jgi:hypothetical protein